ncbi:galactokinase [Alteribacter natronophilus]|uniref:galactokinase n=1 Tax=Alteribacter natronophilus TaxID=2583810 RepID=UPI00110EFC62|nr:galactokinase [Alteribacter natronophilus]TMW70411.1 galactokinase [Alteribacter natronophilus]
MEEKLLQAMKEYYDANESDVRLFFAPGRVNLIGEHIDYNGGFVFPCSLSIGTYMAVFPRPHTDRVRMLSLNFPDKGVVSFDVNKLEYDESDDWANYPKGVLNEFAKLGKQPGSGFDAVFYGNIPNGAGLSSSASIELATAVMWNEINEFGLSMTDLVKIGQRAENDFIGVSCGIMDQFAIGMGRENHAILLDCNTLDYDYSPVELGDYALVIANTNKRRGLADSKYNERRAECESALEAVRTKKEVRHLCDLNAAEFQEVKSVITEPEALKRAKHAVYENERTIQAAELLKEGDLHGFGRLMSQSHVSLRDDYEVSGNELDNLVEAAWSEDSVIGARMTGAGFGGCTVNIVHKKELEQTLGRIGSEYTKKTGLEAEFYIAEIGPGAKELKPVKEGDC